MVLWLVAAVTINRFIGLYRENAIAIESEARDPFGGNVYYVAMQITFPIPEFARKERNLHQTCQVSRIPRESHGFWQFLKAHGRETQCSRIFVNLTGCCDQGIKIFARGLDCNS